MFGRLVQKELAQYLTDFRFIAVFGLCVLLSALSVYVGVENYAQQMREYQATSQTHRQDLQAVLDNRDTPHKGYRWGRRPEPLSPLVFGLSGKLGREVYIQHELMPRMEASLFEEDPIYALFGVLDLAFIVKFVLSLAVLLFIYDAICGEKESGTLRLYASFPVSRAMLALSKLVGAILMALVPFVFCFLVAVCVLVLSPSVALQTEDWLRLGALMVVFALYLCVFAAFGLLASALTSRRLTAFLGLLSLWTIWIFIVPDIGVRLSREWMPVDSSVTVQKRVDELFWQIKRDKKHDYQTHYEERLERVRQRARESLEQLNVKGIDTYLEIQELTKKWGRDMSQEQREQIAKKYITIPEASLKAIREAQMAVYRGEPEEDARAAYYEARDRIEEKAEMAFVNGLKRLREAQRNQLRERRTTTVAVSAISPFSAVTFASMDLCRTGFVQQEQIEDALRIHIGYMAKFIREKGRIAKQDRDVSDFVPFTYRDIESFSSCLARNAYHFLNLTLLAVLGFAGAYVAILRYDVR